MTFKKINILTVFYKRNVEDYFLRYLGSIKSLIRNYPEIDFCVYILDNSPVGRLKKYILENKIEIDKKIKILERDLNGFASSNNYLARISYKDNECNFFLFLNPDTEIIDLGMESFNRLSKDTFFSADLKQYPFEHPKEYMKGSLETSWCSGACLLTDAKKFLNLKGFDETFFMYAEDVDLSWRAWESGYKCYYLPKSLVVHHCYGVEKNYLFRQFWSVRNGVLMSVKHGTIKERFDYKFLILETIISLLRAGKLREFMNILRALFMGCIIGIRYTGYVFRSVKRPDFATFYKFEYAKIRDKYETN